MERFVGGYSGVVDSGYRVRFLIDGSATSWPINKK